MSLKKIEAVCEHLIHQEIEEARKMLHQIVVEKARAVYEELMTAESDDEMTDDASGSFASSIEADMGDIESDEIGGDIEAGDDEEEEIEDRVEDLEDSLAELRAEFDRLMADELEEPEHADLAGEMLPVQESTEPDAVKVPAAEVSKSVSPVATAKKPDSSASAVEFTKASADKTVKSDAKSMSDIDNADVKLSAEKVKSAVNDDKGAVKSILSTPPKR